MRETIVAEDEIEAAAVAAGQAQISHLTWRVLFAAPGGSRAPIGPWNPP